jgi:hypothetical protein
MTGTSSGADRGPQFHFSPVWVRLTPLNFSAGAPVKMLDLVKNPDRVGDTAEQFQAAKQFVPPPPALPCVNGLLQSRPAKRKIVKPSPAI